MKIEKMVHLFAFCFFSLTQSMDEPGKDPKNKNELVATDAGEVRIPMPFTSDSKKEKRKSMVPDLNLVSTQQQSSSSSSEGQRTPVKSLIDLKRAVTVKSLTGVTEGATTRRLVTRSRTAATPSDDTQKPSIDAGDFPAQRAPSLLPKALSEKKISGRHLLGVQDEKLYTKSEMWEKIAHFNPALCAFGKRHGIDLEELEEYAILMQQLDIDPKVITEYAQQNNSGKEKNWFDQGLAYLFGGSKGQDLDHFRKEYDKIKKENPENYKELVLELIKGTVEETLGVQSRSLIADTHTGIQNDKINSQATQINQQWLALAVSIIALIPGWATSAIQYFSPTNGTAT